jgi:hypothetical protein
MLIANSAAERVIVFDERVRVNTLPFGSGVFKPLGEKSELKSRVHFHQTVTPATPDPFGLGGAEGVGSRGRVDLENESSRRNDPCRSAS